MPNFAATRSYRPRVMHAGLAWMIACGVGTAVVALTREDHGIAMYLAAAGTLGYFIATIAAMIPQRVTLDVTTDQIVPSWRGPERGPPGLGAWMASGIDAPMGLVLRVGKLRIGGEGIDGAGYTVVEAASRTVDCQVSRDEFEAVCAAAGLRKGERGPLVVPLVRTSQSAGGMVRTMAPWLLTMLVIGVVSVVAGQSRLMTTRTGQFGLAGISLAIVVGGMVAMVVRTRRIRAPELELRVTPAALVLARAGGDEISHTPWNRVDAACQRFTQTSRAGSYTMPLIVLALEGHVPLEIGAWDPRLAWPGDPPKARRGPRWIVGSAVWPRLVDELRRHHRL